MTIPLTIKQIEMLVKASESKGLSEAARLLNLSPSAISKGLAALEENLGVALIKRTTRNFQLTEAGEFFVARASKLLEEFD
ncbi:LysR family transcriptional regulator, partial [Salmonella enterica]|nr:LysR family transcriptional regulator [Salmonella enterica]ECE1135539.1 LysR family transcriptional regulator [Salmonella enterica]